jgi:general secretion pathway protein K
MPVENGELVGQIEDQQGAFNLNNLVSDGKVNPVQLEHFRRLLSILGLPVQLAYTLADWIDTDGEPQPQGGAEDAYYLALIPPYLTANRPLIDVAELALVAGYDDGVRARLRPYIAALPGSTPVNVKTDWTWAMPRPWSHSATGRIFATPATSPSACRGTPWPQPETSA